LPDKVVVHPYSFGGLSLCVDEASAVGVTAVRLAGSSSDIRLTDFSVRHRPAVEDELVAAMPSGEHVELLELPAGTPVLYYVRTVSPRRDRCESMTILGRWVR
jgi:hypothetical protein